MTKPQEKQDLDDSKRSVEATGNLLRSFGDEPLSRFSELGKRIRQIRTEVADLTRDEMSALFGITRSSLQLYEEGKREPKPSLLFAICLQYGIEAKWLLMGMGEMLEGDWEPGGVAVEPQTYVKGECEDVLGNPVDLEDFVFIPRYDIKAAAGYGAAIPSEAPMFSMAFRRYWIDNYLRLDPDNLAVWSVKGDSMSGVLNDKDAILINLADRNPGSGLYVLRLDGDVIVKRVQRLPGGKLEVRSANDAYSSFEVSLSDPGSDVEVLGRVVWFGRQI